MFRRRRQLERRRLAVLHDDHLAGELHCEREAIALVDFGIFGQHHLLGLNRGANQKCRRQRDLSTTEPHPWASLRRIEDIEYIGWIGKGREGICRRKRATGPVWRKVLKRDSVRDRRRNGHLLAADFLVGLEEFDDGSFAGIAEPPFVPLQDAGVAAIPIGEARTSFTKEFGDGV